MEDFSADFRHLCTKSMEEKGDWQDVGSWLGFIAKLQRKLLRNQLNYLQKIFIIKKIVACPLDTTQMKEFLADPQSFS